MATEITYATDWGLSGRCLRRAIKLFEFGFDEAAKPDIQLYSFTFKKSA